MKAPSRQILGFVAQTITVSSTTRTNRVSKFPCSVDNECSVTTTTELLRSNSGMNYVLAISKLSFSLPPKAMYWLGALQIACFRRFYAKESKKRIIVAPLGVPFSSGAMIITQAEVRDKAAFAKSIITPRPDDVGLLEHLPLGKS